MKKTTLIAAMMVVDAALNSLNNYVNHYHVAHAMQTYSKLLHLSGYDMLELAFCADRPDFYGSYGVGVSISNKITGASILHFSFTASQNDPTAHNMSNIQFSDYSAQCIPGHQVETSTLNCVK